MRSAPGHRSRVLFYPCDQTALPPGVEVHNLVTLVHLVDGIAVGGVTYRMLPDKPREQEC